MCLYIFFPFVVVMMELVYHSTFSVISTRIVLMGLTKIVVLYYYAKLILKKSQQTTTKACKKYKYKILMN